MLIDGIDLLEGSVVENLTISSGDGTAQGNLSPTNGEMFYRTDLNEFQVYINGSWQRIGTGGDLANKVDKTGDTMTGDLSVNTNVSVGGTLDVTGTTTLDNALNVNSNMFVSSPICSFVMNETDQAADEKEWRHWLAGSSYRLAAFNDAGNVWDIALQATRTGASVDSVSFPNGYVEVGSGGGTATSGDISLSGKLVLTDGTNQYNIGGVSNSYLQITGSGDGGSGWKYYFSDRRIEHDGSLVLDNATGGSQGVGTINAKGLYINGVAVGSGGASALNDLNDVDTTNVSDNDELVYNNSTGNWETRNRTYSTSGPSGGSDGDLWFTYE